MLFKGTWTLIPNLALKVLQHMGFQEIFQTSVHSVKLACCNVHTGITKCISDCSFAFIQVNIAHMKANNKPINCLNFYLVETYVEKRKIYIYI